MGQDQSPPGQPSPSPRDALAAMEQMLHLPHAHEIMALVQLSGNLNMPFERHQQFNKQSALLNGAMSIGGWAVKSENEPEDFAQRVPFPDMDFSLLTVPQSNVMSKKPSTKTLVRRLLYPTWPRAFRNGVLSINWVISVAGTQHFRFRLEDERWVLTQSSELRHQGREIGLPAAYHEFLCGDNPENSASEEGMILTRDFFEKEIERE